MATSKTPPPKDAARMSLEELLGHQGGSPTGDYSDLSDDQKRNESGSGMFDLAAMVAARPAQSAQTTPNSIPGTDTSPQPYPAAGGTDTSAVTRKPPLTLIVVAASILVAAIGITAAVVLTSDRTGDTGSTPDLADMEARLQALLAKAQAEGDEETQRTLEAKIQEQQAQLEEQSMEFSEDELPDEESGSEATASGADTRRARTVRATTAASTKAGSSVSSPTGTASTTATGGTTSAAPKTTTKTSAPDTKTSALDSLLTGDATKVQKTGLPEQPSRDEVTSVMNDIAAKARSTCGGSGSTVSVRVIVGSNGQVRDAIPVGDHATDTLGRCVSTIARRTARFKPFSKPTFTFTYPLRL